MNLFRRDRLLILNAQITFNLCNILDIQLLVNCALHRYIITRSTCSSSLFPLPSQGVSSSLLSEKHTLSITMVTINYHHDNNTSGITFLLKKIRKRKDPCLSFFFWPLCCLFFFDMRILITPLVSSNSSCIIGLYQ